MTHRNIAQIAKGMPASDGAGVKLTRIVGSPELPRVDPFLMLDAFKSDKAGDYIAGFPPHPHRGFETVTYMVAGRMRHKDNKGNEGVIEPGGVQWMTAGRGIIHSEMPEQEDGLMWGFQLWVNLPAEHKMVEPGYKEFDDAGIPRDIRDQAVIKVIAGKTSRGVEGAVKNVVTNPLYLDVHLEAGAVLDEPVSDDMLGFVVPYIGSLVGPTDANGRRVPNQSVGVLGLGDTLRLEAGDEPTRALVIAAAPLREPVAQHGPFVMNTREQLVEAVNDYNAGRF